MSRIGKQPIPLPAGVKVNINKNEVTVEGKGNKKLTQTFHPDMEIVQENAELIVKRPSDQRHHRALHGLTRALLNNMVMGVSEGFKIVLIIEGVSYRAEMDGTNLVLHLGYSHKIVVNPTDTLSFDVPKDSRGHTIIIDGIDKQEVGEMAAYIRKQRPPEPYKGKGIRYQNEVIRRKAGKAGKA